MKFWQSYCKNKTVQFFASHGKFEIFTIHMDIMHSNNYSLSSFLSSAVNAVISLTSILRHQVRDVSDTYVINLPYD